MSVNFPRWQISMYIATKSQCNKSEICCTDKPTRAQLRHGRQWWPQAVSPCHSFTGDWLVFYTTRCRMPVLGAHHEACMASFQMHIWQTGKLRSDHIALTLQDKTSFNCMSAIWQPQIFEKWLWIIDKYFSMFWVGKVEVTEPMP